MYDLFVDEAYDPSNAPDGGVDALRDAAPTRVNPELLQVIAQPVAPHLRQRPRSRSRWPRPSRRPRRRSGRPRDGPLGRAGSGGRPGGGATRAEVLERLEREALLPAITFIFSRVGCEAAVGQLLAPERPAGPRRGGRADPAHRRGAGLTALADEDLGVLGYWDFVDGLSRGFAAHHAGMLPTFREVVEELFTAGRIRAVFATETLALGHQHAGAHGRARAAGEVQRRGPRRRHAGGVHPADRAGRTARHRHRGPRRRPVEPAARPAGRGRSGVDADVPAAVQLPARPTTWRSTSSPSSAASAARELLETSFAQFQADRAVVGFVQDDPAQRGGAGRVRRGDAVRPRRLRRVRRHPRRDPAGSRRTPSSVGRPASAPRRR